MENSQPAHHPLLELEHLLAKSRSNSGNNRAYEDVTYTIDNNDKALKYTVSFNKKSPSEKIKEKAQEAASQGQDPNAVVNQEIGKESSSSKVLLKVALKENKLTNLKKSYSREFLEAMGII